jgi:hypothetical protein
MVSSLWGVIGICTSCRSGSIIGVNETSPVPLTVTTGVSPVSSTGSSECVTSHVMAARSGWSRFASRTMLRIMDFLPARPTRSGARLAT